ncbi:MAG: peptidyl-prolyl cis-trans isomerase [Deltaproteobacteria bacterium]|nr:peptidyl-prolyl cis-trans isomerase [Deltaproteobacteria bacterium]
MRKLFLFFLTVGVCLAFPVGAASAAAKERSLVKLETTKGEIIIELFPDKAPKTVANFLSYVNAGAYDGTIFHRVMDGFMIQGGGFEPDMRPRPTNAPIRNEADNGLKNERYTLAMARTNDPHSASNQFFINVADNDFLDHRSKTSQGWGYAVFGKVVDGMRVVDAIKAVPTGNRAGHQNVPRDPVVIVKASVFKLR